MSYKTTEQRITEIIVDQFGVNEENVVPTADLISDLGADSLDQVELVMAVEEEFDIEIEDSEAEAVKTVQGIIDLVKSKQG